VTLSRRGAHPTRLAGRLVEQSKLVPLAHGLYLSPKEGPFGLIPASDDELRQTFLDGGDYVFTGPERWNALTLGTTAPFASALVYATPAQGATPKNITVAVPRSAGEVVASALAKSHI
jgi:hypothetical protein